MVRGRGRGAGLGGGARGRLTELRVMVSNVDYLGVVSLGIIPSICNVSPSVLVKVNLDSRWREARLRQPGGTCAEGEPRGPWVHLFVEKGSV